MRKNVERLIEVGYAIQLALELEHFALYLREEKAFIEFTITRKISNHVLEIIPNSFFIYPKDNSVCILRVYEMEEENI